MSSTTSAATQNMTKKETRAVLESIDVNARPQNGTVKSSVIGTTTTGSATITKDQGNGEGDVISPRVPIVLTKEEEEMIKRFRSDDEVMIITFLGIFAVLGMPIIYLTLFMIAVVQAGQTELVIIAQVGQTELHNIFTEIVADISSINDIMVITFVGIFAVLGTPIISLTLFITKRVFLKNTALPSQVHQTG